MRVTRLGRGATAAHVRALVPPPPDVEGAVSAILADVRSGGDGAVARLTERFDGARIDPEAVRVPQGDLAAAADALDPALRAAIEAARANVRQVSEAQLGGGASIELADGQRVEIVELAVRRAAAYVPGGRAPYPSTVVMCAETASAAGVEEIVVCAPPHPGGRAHPVILAACRLCGVAEVHLMGGAQAVAALAYGTERIAPVDLIVGPGNAYVREAKRQLVGTVGIHGLAGPSELVVVASAGAEPELLARDLLAQAEHGPDARLCLISDATGLVGAVEEAVERMAPERPSVHHAPLALIEVEAMDAALALAEAIAPEHLELAGAEAEALAGRVRSAGCLFVGRDAATAFGDYIAGSNHVLPTSGAARWESALGVGTFRRRMARVSLPPGAAGRLAPAGATLARAEGFPVHGESMERRS